MSPNTNILFQKIFLGAFCFLFLQMKFLPLFSLRYLSLPPLILASTLHFNLPIWHSCLTFCSPTSNLISTIREDHCIFQRYFAKQRFTFSISIHTFLSHRFPRLSFSFPLFSPIDFDSHWFSNLSFCFQFPTWVWSCSWCRNSGTPRQPVCKGALSLF